jgi:outer membrane protein assembly factor BamD (BamD/ComL family)
VEAPSELTLLQGAQDALGADPGRALELLDAHRRAYPTGSLAQEREVLAIDALLRLRHRQRAEQRAARFRARYPTSGQIRRIETLLSES